MKATVYSIVMPVIQEWWVNLLMGLLFLTAGILVFNPF
ncbi:hypothetical protein [Cerina litoralis]